MSDNQKIIRELVKELLEKLDIQASIEVIKNDDNSLRVNLTGDDLGILIGYHGETLFSLQLWLSLALHKQLGEWVKILVDVSGYRQVREEKLKGLAQRAADKARFLQTTISLSPMSSYERRVVHTTVGSSYEDLESVSEGEGRERHVVIRPKSHKNIKT